VRRSRLLRANSGQRYLPAASSRYLRIQPMLSGLDAGSSMTIRIHRTIDRSNGSATSPPNRYLADFIINIVGPSSRQGQAAEMGHYTKGSGRGASRASEGVLDPLHCVLQPEFRSPAFLSEQVGRRVTTRCDETVARP